MESNVSHAISLPTWLWLSVGYYDPNIGLSRYIQYDWLFFPHQSKHGKTLPMQMQWEGLHQWGPMARTQRSLEKGHAK